MERILTDIGRANLIKLISNQNLGKNILKEVSEKKKISLIKVLNWVFYTENFLRCLRSIKNTFSEIFITEFVENSYKIKIKKNLDSKTSIGFLFGLLEDQVKYYFNFLEKKLQFNRIFDFTNFFRTNF